MRIQIVDLMDWDESGNKIVVVWPGSMFDLLWILEVYFYQVLDPFYREFSPVFRGGSAEFSVEHEYSFYDGLVCELSGRV